MSSRIIYTSKRGIQPSTAQKMGKRLLFAIFLFIFLIAGGIYAVENPRWHVSHIRVEGARRLDAGKLEGDVLNMLAGSRFAFIPKNFYAFIDTKRISEELRRIHPGIETVRVDSNASDILTVRIEERTFWGVLCNDLEASEWVGELDNAVKKQIQNKKDSLPEKEILCVYIDSSGFAFDTAPKSSGSLIIRIRSDFETILPPTQGIARNSMNVLLSLTREIPHIIQERAIGFELLSRVPLEIRVLTSGGYALWMSRDQDIPATLSALNTLLKEEIKERKNDLEYVDLRFGNKVFYKFKVD